MSKKLTAKQQRFKDEYLIDNNATQAAIRAGYSKKTAKSQGQRLLTNVDIKAAIKAGQKDIAKRNGLTIDDILDELEEARKIAKEEGKGAPMVAASMGKAKLLGLIVDKAETKTEGNISIDISFK
ncbi:MULTISPECIES: terminase small subunit [unclassified Psychrobacter]|uniref:terminase small subunit n=1 Tax=unclassified Psychrobacter TaxID=196806 RepID=UPI0025FD8A9C|nr:MULTISPECIES: terminase small subunit [unclassified Psychrobacter]